MAGTWQAGAEQPRTGGKDRSGKGWLASGCTSPQEIEGAQPDCTRWVCFYGQIGGHGGMQQLNAAGVGSPWLIGFASALRIVRVDPINTRTATVVRTIFIWKLHAARGAAMG
jgi:hypothetical protein